MKYQRASSALVSLLVTGCTTLQSAPPDVPQQGAQVSDVVRTVVCELQSVMSNAAARRILAKFVASAELTLGRTLSNSAAPTVKISSPSFPAGASFPLGGGTSNTSQTKNVVDFSVKMATLVPGAGGGASTLCDAFRPRVNGAGLGLAAKILDDVAATDGQATLTGSTYDVIFSASLSGNGGLTFNTAIFNVDIGKPTGGATDANELKVTLAPPSADKTKNNIVPQVVVEDRLQELLSQ